jgi:hypothetical protein
MGNVPLYDQRGAPFTRVFDGDGTGGARIDIGAFEVQVIVEPPALLGDYNQNNVVDAADHVLWRYTLGDSVAAPYDGADGDGDGIVDQDDYGVWVANFGRTQAAAAAHVAKSLRDSNLAVSEKLPHVAESLRDSEATVSAGLPHMNRDSGSVASALAEPVAHRVSSVGALVGIVASTAGQASGSTRRPVLRELPIAATARDDALVAWLAATAPVPRREFPGADLDSLTDEPGFTDSPDAYGAAVDCVLATLADRSKR